MKIFARDNNNVQEIDKFIGKNLWVKTVRRIYGGMDYYWVKLHDKYTTRNNGHDYVIYEYESVIDWGTSRPDPDDININEDSMRFDLVHPLEVLTDEELFGDDTDVWTTQRNHGEEYQ